MKCANSFLFKKNPLHSYDLFQFLKDLMATAEESKFCWLRRWVVEPQSTRAEYLTFKKTLRLRAVMAKGMGLTNWEQVVLLYPEGSQALSRFECECFYYITHRKVTGYGI